MNPPTPVRWLIAILWSTFLILSPIAGLMTVFLPTFLILSVALRRHALFMRSVCWMLEVWNANANFFIERIINVQFEIHGCLPERESALFIANHQGQEWFPQVCMCARNGCLGLLRTLIKEKFKYIPGIGWGIIACKFPTISGNPKRFEEDKVSLVKSFEEYQGAEVPIQIAIYPESTRLSAKKLKDSQEYAKEHGHPHLEELMLPRHRGLMVALQALKAANGNALYDMTLMYDGWRKDRKYPGLWALATGPYDGSCKLKVHCERIPLSDIPVDDEAKLKQWLMDRWAKKDKVMQQFKSTGNVPDKDCTAKWDGWSMGVYVWVLLAMALTVVVYGFIVPRAWRMVFG